MPPTTPRPTEAARNGGRRAGERASSAALRLLDARGDRQRPAIIVTRSTAPGTPGTPGCCSRHRGPRVRAARRHALPDGPDIGGGRRVRARDPVAQGRRRPAGCRRHRLLRRLHPTTMLQLEDYGFCRKGEGGQYVSDGTFGSAATPNDTSGGHSARAHARHEHGDRSVRQLPTTRRQLSRRP